MGQRESNFAIWQVRTGENKITGLCEFMIPSLTGVI